MRDMCTYPPLAASSGIGPPVWPEPIYYALLVPQGAHARVHGINPELCGRPCGAGGQRGGSSSDVRHILFSMGLVRRVRGRLHRPATGQAEVLQRQAKVGRTCHGDFAMGTATRAQARHCGAHLDVPCGLSTALARVREVGTGHQKRAPCVPGPVEAGTHSGSGSSTRAGEIPCHHVYP